MPKNPKMKIKLLLYLNQVPCNIKDIAEHLYRNRLYRSIQKTYSLIRNAVDLGWEIIHVGKAYYLSEEHHKLIRDNDGLVFDWPHSRIMTLEAVERAIK